MTKKLNPSQISDKLNAAAKRNERDKVQDNAVDKLARMFKHMDIHEQLVVMASYQAALILEIANYDTDKATSVWQANCALSGRIIRDMHNNAVERDEAPPRGAVVN